LDMKESNTALTLSHVAAKQELASLINMIQLPNHSKKAKVA
jgi:hypothetical protein